MMRLSVFRWFMLGCLNALLCLYTSCAHKQFPTQSLNQEPLKVSEENWPKRIKVSKGVFTVTLDGKAMIDCGVYRNCRVLKAPLLTSKKTKKLHRPDVYTLGSLSEKRTQSLDECSLEYYLQSSAWKRENTTIAQLWKTSYQSRKGMIVYLTGYSLNSFFERRIIKKFNVLGWDVLEVMVNLEIGDFAQKDFAIDPKRPGRLLAQAVDHHLTERAYVVESMLSYFSKKEPSLLQGELVLFGTSLGGISAPAVVARCPKFDAVVLLVAGANFSAIAHESSLNLFKLKKMQLAKKGEKYSLFSPVEITEEEIKKAYTYATANTRLDPLKTAGALSATPTLLLHGSFDKIVPAYYGDQLHQLMPFAERWSYPLGHFFMVAHASSIIPNVDRWISSQLEESKR